jgi:hypothetical protein
MYCADPQTYLLSGNKVALEKRWNWATELINKLLLVKEHRDNTAWLVAARVGNTELRQKLGECSRSNKS